MGGRAGRQGEWIGGRPAGSGGAGQRRAPRIARPHYCITCASTPFPCPRPSSIMPAKAASKKAAAKPKAVKKAKAAPKKAKKAAKPKKAKKAAKPKKA